MSICGYSQEDRDYARFCHLQDGEDSLDYWSRAIVVAEQLSIDADELSNDRESTFWFDVMARCEDRWKHAASAYDRYLHWAEAV